MESPGRRPVTSAPCSVRLGHSSSSCLDVLQETDSKPWHRERQSTGMQVEMSRKSSAEAGREAEREEKKSKREPGSEVRNRNGHIIDKWFSNVAHGPAAALGNVLEKQTRGPTQA